MAVTSGAASKLTVSTSSGGTYDEISGLKDASLDAAIDALDVTAFSDTSGSGSDRTYIAGLRGFSGSFSGTYQPSDTGLAKLKTIAYGSYANLFVKFLFDGTNGYRFEVIVTAFKQSTKVDGTVDVSIDYTVTGSLTAVP